ncbi:interleukin-1 receptor type 2 isoform X2 [Etheostoma cragini]|uniref:interleukin-1 receptor type 2 isoform X2 n=1 Tax=Etheostoma cragini TaxID=417921 RepID=UPI00155E1698|nr:interleukin-1 receptor type 2 isoform X2 [Etheostoma cragini]XP_034741342.1 interleukin-1 receptor type 2 isoform X2 [Etheostoma cragini]
MVRLVLMFAVVFIEYVYGRFQLPPLPMKEGCYFVYPEVNILRLEGEAIILSFSMFESVLKVRKIAPPTATFLITKDNGTEGLAFQGDGRVQQRNKQLWILPAQASDSGKYICTYRNETYCVTGSITLQVYKSSSVDMEKMIHPYQAMVGESLNLSCPSLDDFNNTDRLVEWHKDSLPQLGRAGSFLQNRGRLIIPAVKRSHAGVYTCKLSVLISGQQYKVSRTIKLDVEGLDPVIPTTTTSRVPDLSMMPNPGLISSSSTINTPVIQPPVIVSPLNGTIFESVHGSGVELFCKVFTECQMTDSTLVTWLVNDQSVESSYIDRRALQGGKRVTRVSEGCQIELRLVIVAITEQDVKTELKCVTQNQGGRQEVVTQLQLEDSTFTWLVVATVAVSCFLTVVSAFLYVLFKPKKKMDYFLARQNSTF